MNPCHSHYSCVFRMGIAAQERAHSANDRAAHSTASQLVSHHQIPPKTTAIPGATGELNRWPAMQAEDAGAASRRIATSRRVLGQAFSTYLMAAVITCVRRNQERSSRALRPAAQGSHHARGRREPTSGEQQLSMGQLLASDELRSQANANTRVDFEFLPSINVELKDATYASGTQQNRASRHLSCIHGTGIASRKCCSR